MSTALEFLTQVLPWPGENDPGYVNLHWVSKARDGSDKKFWGGKPVRTVDDFIWWRNWALRAEGITDIYFCTSLQSQAQLKADNKLRVVRKAVNATKLKAIWVDLDVKAPPKGYASHEEAVKAVIEFWQTRGLPPASALINSGGGVHAYWISDKPLEPDEWQEYANGLRALAEEAGLRADFQCTIDRARVLRVPGTFNYKTDTPRPVALLGMGPLITFASTLATLRQKASTTKAISGHVKEAVGLDPTVFPRLPPVENELALGINRASDLPPLDPRPISKSCAFIRTALETYGKDYTEPLWNLTTLCSTFFKNGRAFAHEMSRGHPGYDPEETDEKYDQKVKATEEQGIGWPSCQSIHGAGFASCQSCPVFKLGKSPLHLALAAQQPTSLPPAFATATVTPCQKLPEGFTLNSDGFICKVMHSKDDDGVIRDEHIQVLGCKLADPWVQKEPRALNFTVSQDKGHFTHVSLLMPDMDAKYVSKALLDRGVLYRSPGKRFLEELMTSFQQKLWDATEATETAPYGWVISRNGTLRGFSYGGLVYNKDGSSDPAGHGDKTVHDVFSPVGTADVWMRNWKELIKAQGRPELETIVAAAFAAPLVHFTGHNGAVLSAWGQSGRFKTTATIMGTTVWGHPHQGRENTSSTSRSVLNKMGQLRNLPLFWDDIRNEKDRYNLLDATMAVDKGREQGRLNTKILQVKPGSWETLLMASSNESFLNFIAKVHQTHDAGLARILEYEVPLPQKDTGVRESDAERYLGDLRNNYGCVGAMYAKHIAQRYDAIKARIVKAHHAVEDRLKPKTHERFWCMLSAVFCVGAELANELGIGFDVPALQDFLDATITGQRVLVKQEGARPDEATLVQEKLGEFLRDHEKNSLWTENCPNGRGRTAVGLVQIVRPMGEMGGVAHPCYIQWIQNIHKLRFSRAVFKRWLDMRKIPDRPVVSGLAKHLGMITLDQHILASGTKYKASQPERLYEIEVKPDTPLWDKLFNFGADPNSPLPPTTGAPNVPGS